MDKIFKVGQSSKYPLKSIASTCARPTTKRPLGAPSTGLLMVVSNDRPGSCVILNLLCLKTELVCGVLSKNEKLGNFNHRHLKAYLWRQNMYVALLGWNHSIFKAFLP